jgi:protein-disulfide isomerase
MPNARQAKSTREKAAALRKEAEKKAARKRTLLAGLAVVLTIVVATGVVIFARSLPTHGATPRNLVDGGVLVGQQNAKVTVEVYADFMCPICKEFEQASGTMLTDLTKDGKVRVINRPVAILDHQSTTAYSTRTLNLAAAVLDSTPNAYAKFTASLFENQPPEQSAGLPDSKLIELAVAAGAPKAAMEKAAKEQPYRDWAKEVSDQLSKKYPPGGTPTVVVNGTWVKKPTSDNLKAAVDKALG